MELIDSIIEQQQWSSIERIRAIVGSSDKTAQLFHIDIVVKLDKYKGVIVLSKDAFYIMEGAFDNSSDTSMYDSRVGSSNSNSKTVFISQSSSKHEISKSSSKLSSDEKGNQPFGFTSLLERCIRYDEVREVYKRRHNFRETGLECYLIDGSNILIMFSSDKERNMACSIIVRNQMSALSISNANPSSNASLLQRHSSSVNSVSSSSKNDYNTKQISGEASSIRSATLERAKERVKKEWLAGKLTNFAYLMHLNTLAGRSHNDLTQYPVFPWVLSDYSSETLDLSNPKVYRDLSKPMGALNEERASKFQSHYIDVKEHTSTPYHYATHYSCSAYVMDYLIRTEPFSSAARRLQNGRFDYPDRIFNSIEQAWMSASGEENPDNQQDVRELIPEFFYFPDFLLNSNDFDFGTTQAGFKVNDVILPRWANGSAREFIRLHRKALESKYVTEHLHQWIDLIFGYKQKGKHGIEALNIFHPMTYEDSFTLDRISNPKERADAEAYSHNFGQTPIQLFDRPHPKRTVGPSAGSLGSSGSFFAQSGTLSTHSSLASATSNTGSLLSGSTQMHPRLLPPLVTPSQHGGGIRPHNFLQPQPDFETMTIPGSLCLVPISDLSTIGGYLKLDEMFSAPSHRHLYTLSLFTAPGFYPFQQLMSQSNNRNMQHTNSSDSQASPKNSSYSDSRGSPSPSSKHGGSEFDFSSNKINERKLQGNMANHPSMTKENGSNKQQSWLTSTINHHPNIASDMFIQSDKVYASIGPNIRIVSNTRFFSFGGDDGSLMMHVLQGTQDRVVAVFEGLHNGRITTMKVISEGEGIGPSGSNPVYLSPGIMIGGGGGGGLVNGLGAMGNINMTTVNRNNSNAYVIITGGLDGVVSVWHLKKDQANSWLIDQVCSFSGHSDSITSVDINLLFGVIVSGSSDGKAILWDLGKKIYYCTLSPNPNEKEMKLSKGPQILDRQERYMPSTSPTPIASVNINTETGDIYVINGRNIQLYSINGDFLAETVIPEAYGTPTCALATSCGDYQSGITLLTGHNNGHIICWDLVYLGGDGVAFNTDYQKSLNTSRGQSSNNGYDNDQDDLPIKKTFSNDGIATADTDEVASNELLDDDYGESRSAINQAEIIHATTALSTTAEQMMSEKQEVKSSSMKIGMRGVLKFNHRHQITSLCISLDQRQFASGDSSGKITHWVSGETSLAQSFQFS